jgi:hypothetical protein
MKSIVLFASILRIVFITAILGLAVYANAQSIAVNTNGAVAEASAMLDISSTSKGFLPPRMTTIQRTGIPAPANGLMVFDTDTKSYWYFSITWKEIGNGSGFLLPYSGSSSDAGKMFSVINNSTSGGAAALYGRSSAAGSGIFTLYSMGVWGDNSTGIGVMGTSNNIGILGNSGNAVDGIGVKGLNSSDSRAAVTGENILSGGGVKGVFTGPQNSFGYGVIGETGKNGNIGVAGKFISNNPADPTNTLWALNYGSGPGLTVTMNNSQNAEAAIEVNHTGTGKLLNLDGVNGSFDVNNNGNTTTSGTLTVKGNKGIVRNSTSTQMRIETLNATYSGNVVLSPLGSESFNVFFTTTFSSPPSVYIGNIITDGSASYMSTYIKNVTVTGCTLVIRNTTNSLLALTTSTWKLIAIGAE